MANKDGRFAVLEKKIMRTENRLAKVLRFVEKGESSESILCFGSKDFPLWDYLCDLSPDERDRFLFNNDRAYGGQLQLL